jgi:acetyl esterase
MSSLWISETQAPSRTVKKNRIVSLMSEIAAEPLYQLLRQNRRPVYLRESIATCLRHIYMGDPLTGETKVLPSPPAELFEEVSSREITISGIRCVIYSPKQPCTGLLLYMHGGGFVVGSSEDTDYTMCIPDQSCM